METVKLQIEKMTLTKFKKETGFEPAMKKCFDKVKKAKAKPISVEVGDTKSTFTPGPKGKTVVSVIYYDKMKKLSKGPVKDRSLVVAYEGDKKKKTYLYAMRFQTEQGFRTFIQSADKRNAKPPPASEPTPEPTNQAAQVSKSSSSSSSSSSSRSRSRASTQPKQKTATPSRDNTPSKSLSAAAVVKTRSRTSSSTSSAPSIREYSAPAPAPVMSAPSPVPTQSIIEPSRGRSRSLSSRSPPPPSIATSKKSGSRRRHHLRSKSRSRSISLTSLSSQSSRDSKKQNTQLTAYQGTKSSATPHIIEPVGITTTFVTSDTSYYSRNGEQSNGHSKREIERTADIYDVPFSHANNNHHQPKQTVAPLQHRKSRRSNGPVQIFRVIPGMGAVKAGNSGSSYYYPPSNQGSRHATKSRSISSSSSSSYSSTERLRAMSSSSSSSDSSGSSSSESIATRWLRNGSSAPRSRGGSSYRGNRSTSSRNGDVFEVSHRNRHSAPPNKHKGSRHRSASYNSSYSSSSSESTVDVRGSSSHRSRRGGGGSRKRGGSPSSMSSQSSDSRQRQHHHQHRAPNSIGRTSGQPSFRIIRAR